MNFFFQLNNRTDITYAEELMGLSFPSELREFYFHAGYGFLTSGAEMKDVIMHPMSAAAFRLHEGPYRYVPDMDEYDQYTKDRLVFFHSAKDTYYSIELTTRYRQKIYCLDKLIADSFHEFLVNYPEHRPPLKQIPLSRTQRRIAC